MPQTSPGHRASGRPAGSLQQGRKAPLRHLPRQFLNTENMEEIPQNLWSESFKKKHKT